MRGLGVGILMACCLGSSGLALAQAPAIALPDRFAPESMAAGADGTLYIGSTTEGAIYRARHGAAKAEPFIPSGTPGLLSVEGLAVDERAGVLWACSADLGLRTIDPKPPSSLHAFDLATGSFQTSFSLPGGGFCNDVALDARGRPYVTDSVNPRILRVSADGTALEEWLRDPLLGGPSFQLNGIAFDSDQNLYVDKSASGALLRIEFGPDGKPGKITPIRLSTPIAWPDAIRVVSPGRLLVFDSPVGKPGHIHLIEVKGDLGQVMTLAGNLDSPSSGVIVGGAVRFIESRFANWFDPVRKTQAPEPFRVRSIPLPQ